MRCIALGLVLSSLALGCGGSDMDGEEECPWGARIVSEHDAETDITYECCELADGTQHGQCYEGGGCTPYPDCYERGGYNLGARCGHWEMVGRDGTAWASDYEPCPWAAESGDD